MVLCFGNYLMNIWSLKQLGEIDTADEKMEEKILSTYSRSCGCLEASPRMELLCIPMADPPPPPVLHLLSRC